MPKKVARVSLIRVGGSFQSLHILHSLLQFLQLYQMSLENQSQSDPFIIVYNQRKTSKLQNQEKKVKRRHHDYSTLPHSIIVTRRMAAELQHKKQQDQKQLQSEENSYDNLRAAQGQVREDVNFFDDEDLDRCIPMDDLPQEDIPYNLNDPTLSSNYSKLERTLYGMGITAYEEDLQDSQK